MDPIDAHEAADQLYAAAPEDFVARRNELAKQAKAAGDAEAAARIKDLRKPTAAAWLANQLSRAHADEIADLLLLGDELRAASATLDGDRLRELSPRRQDTVRDLVRQARTLAQEAGRQVSPDVAQKLSETLDAAMIDPSAAAAVRAGQLTSALRHVGFGLVDESGEPSDLSNVVSIAQARATRAPAEKAKAAARKSSTKSGPESGEERAAEKAAAEEEAAPAKETAAERRKREAAEEAFAEAETELDQADDAVSELADELDRRKQAVKDAQSEVERLVAELEDAREELDSARRAVRRGSEELDDARKDARTARRQHREAKLRLDRLSPG